MAHSESISAEIYRAVSAEVSHCLDKAAVAMVTARAAADMDAVDLIYTTRSRRPIHSQRLARAADRALSWGVRRG